ncbi:MAG: hypothetical protein B5M52_00635 [Helicobacteraceae bacterium 4484_230]|nr:MAG: hypothetical protein B5M52_00635 [Helicobacteraceae bacterium 4484_230]
MKIPIFVAQSIILSLFFLGCGGGGGSSGGGGGNEPTFTAPTDYETQPQYAGAVHHYTQDSDGDGISDINDPAPSDGAVKSLTVFNEKEFNNNIGEANAVQNAGYPIIIAGNLAKGASYYLDSDFFKFNGKKDQRISIMVFEGSVNSDGNVFTPEKQFFSPKATLLDKSGKVITSLEIDGLEGVACGIGAELPIDGDYYIEISDPSINSKDYDYSYYLVINTDSDFDGVSDGLEDVIGSNKFSSDSDSDNISDFNEIFPLMITYPQAAGRSSVNWWDVDSDNIPNWWDVDSDGDGPADRKEGALDLDNDAIENFLDTDSNNNGTPDGSEAGESFQQPVDTDGDGLYDFMDLDADNDGIPTGLDSNEHSAQAPEYMFDKQAQGIMSVQTVIDADTTLNGICLIGKELLINGFNIKAGTKVLFPIVGGTKAVIPTEIDTEGNYLKITVPDEAVSGTMYLYGTDSKLSNGFDVNVENSMVNPVIFPVQSSLSTGDTLTLYGLNLSEGQINIVFSSNSSGRIQASGTASGDKVVLTVPNGASSGVLYAEVGGKASNSVAVSIISDIKAKVEIPAGTGINCSDVQITQQDGITKYADAQCWLNGIEIDSNNINFISTFHKDSADEIHLFYEAVALPADATITLNSLSTAVKIVFYNLGYHISQSRQEWENILNTIRSDQNVKALADYIEQDPTVLAQFTDAALISRFQEALISCSSSIAKYLSPQLRGSLSKSNVKSASLISRALVEPDITPSKAQYDILLHPIAPANIEVENETRVYLSIEVTDPSDNYIGYTDAKGLYRTYSHIKHMFDPNILSPQWGGLLLISLSKDFKLEGRDSHFDIVTGGMAAPNYSSSVYNYTVGRTLFDGMAAPVLNKILEKIIGKKIKSKDAAALLVELIGAEKWSNFITDAVSGNGKSLATPLNIYIIIPLKELFGSCVKSKPGPLCEKFAIMTARILGLSSDKIKGLIVKTLGKEVAAYLIPGAGQIKAAYEIYDKIDFFGTLLVTAKDIGTTPRIVGFDVDYPLEIEEVKPMCLVKEKNEDLLLLGKGFLPYKSGSLWWKKEVTPVTSLDSEKGDFKTANNDGTKMLVNFRWALEFLSSGEHTLKVEHQGQKTVFAQKIKVATDGIILDSISPNKGFKGSIVTLTGCGFSKVATENMVWFKASQDGFTINRVRATVLSSNADKLTVVVPDDAITGDVYVSANNMQSNSLLFTVDSANVVITYGDCGNINDDTFSLYVDNKLVSSMSAPSRPFPVQVEMQGGTHTVKMVGITAPDDVGTYCIEFSSNVSVISGPARSGNDLTAGVVKSWQVEVATTALSPARNTATIEGKVLLPE